MSEALRPQEDDTALLAGVTVVEIGKGAAVAFCGKLFVDSGAQVIKIESPDGGDLRDGMRTTPLSALLLAGKQSVALRDDAAGTNALGRIVADADILLVGSDIAEAAEALAANPRPGSVVVRFSPYGLTGPYARFLGSNITALAGGGMMHMVGDQGREPLMLGGLQGDYSTGVSGFTGALFAHHDAVANGKAHVVDANGLETAAYMEWKSGIYEQTDGIPRSRGAKSQWVDVVCTDGLVGFVYENSSWPKILDLIPDERLRDARFATRDARVENNEALTAVIQTWADGKTKAEVYDSAQLAGVPVGLVATVADVMASPQYTARQFFKSVTHPDLGEVRHPSAAWTVNGLRPPVNPSPTIGRDTAATLHRHRGA